MMMRKGDKCILLYCFSKQMTFVKKEYEYRKLNKNKKSYLILFFSRLTLINDILLIKIVTKQLNTFLFDSIF